MMLISYEQSKRKQICNKSTFFCDERREKKVFTKQILSLITNKKSFETFFWLKTFRCNFIVFFVSSFIWLLWQWKVFIWIKFDHQRVGITWKRARSLTLTKHIRHNNFPFIRRHNILFVVYYEFFSNYFYTAFLSGKQKQNPTFDMRQWLDTVVLNGK